MDLFVLPLSGAELVLGVQWIKILGPILSDYAKLTMRFSKDGTPVHLTRVPKPGPKKANIHQLQLLITSDAIDT